MGPKRSNSPAEERPKNDGVCSFRKKGTFKKGKGCKFKHPKSSAPAEKGSDTESETGSEKKKKKKKAKAAPVIRGPCGRILRVKQNQPSAKRKLWIAMLKPHALPLPREPSGITPRKGSGG